MSKTKWICPAPTKAPTTAAPTLAPTSAAPTTAAPTLAPTTAAPTFAPTTAAPTTAAPTLPPEIACDVKLSTLCYTDITNGAEDKYGKSLCFDDDNINDLKLGPDYKNIFDSAWTKRTDNLIEGTTISSTPLDQLTDYVSMYDITALDKDEKDEFNCQIKCMNTPLCVGYATVDASQFNLGINCNLYSSIELFDDGTSIFPTRSGSACNNTYCDPDKILYDNDGNINNYTQINFRPNKDCSLPCGDNITPEGNDCSGDITLNTCPPPTPVPTSAPTREPPYNAKFIATATAVNSATGIIGDNVNINGWNIELDQSNIGYLNNGRFNIANTQSYLVTCEILNNDSNAIISLRQNANTNPVANAIPLTGRGYVQYVVNFSDIVDQTNNQMYFRLDGTYESVNVKVTIEAVGPAVFYGTATAPPGAASPSGPQSIVGGPGSVIPLNIVNQTSEINYLNNGRFEFEDGFNYILTYRIVSDISPLAELVASDNSSGAPISGLLAQKGKGATESLVNVNTIPDPTNKQLFFRLIGESTNETKIEIALYRQVVGCSSNTVSYNVQRNLTCISELRFTDDVPPRRNCASVFELNDPLYIAANDTNQAFVNSENMACKGVGLSLCEAQALCDATDNCNYITHFGESDTATFWTNVDRFDDVSQPSTNTCSTSVYRNDTPIVTSAPITPAPEYPDRFNTFQLIGTTRASSLCRGVKREIDDNQLDIGNVTNVEACKQACIDNNACRGIQYKSDTKQCTLTFYTPKTVQYTNDPGYSCYALDDPNDYRNTYIARSENNCKSVDANGNFDNYYKVFNDFTESECEIECNRPGNTLCKGFDYDIDNKTCSLINFTPVDIMCGDYTSKSYKRRSNLQSIQYIDSGKTCSDNENCLSAVGGEKECGELPNISDRCCNISSDFLTDQCQEELYVGEVCDISDQCRPVAGQSSCGYYTADSDDQQCCPGKNFGLEAGQGNACVGTALYGERCYQDRSCAFGAICSYDNKDDLVCCSNRFQIDFRKWCEDWVDKNEKCDSKDSRQCKGDLVCVENALGIYTCRDP